MRDLMSAGSLCSPYRRGPRRPRSSLSSRRNASPGALQRPSRFCSDDVLFPGSGSGVVADTLATFVTVFCVLTCTVAVTLAPLPSVLVRRGSNPKGRHISNEEIASTIRGISWGSIPPGSGTLSKSCPRKQEGLSLRNHYSPSKPPDQKRGSRAPWGPAARSHCGRLHAA